MADANPALTAIDSGAVAVGGRCDDTDMARRDVYHTVKLARVAH